MDRVFWFLKNAPFFLIIGVIMTFIVSFFTAWLKKKTAKPFLNRTIQDIRLVDKVILSHDSFRLRFELPSFDFCIGLPPGKHVKVIGPNREGQIKGEWNGKVDPETNKTEIERKYTPVTGDEFPGYVDFVIKAYRGGSKEQFPDGGKLSQYLDNVKIGELVQIQGPIGLLTYHGRGHFTRGQIDYRTKFVGMIAGGTGITPMLQVLRRIFTDRFDETKVSLIYANQTEDDILCRDILEEFATHYPTQLKVWYTIDRLAPDDKKWKYSIGYINEALLQEHFPPPTSGALILSCGPKPMVESCENILTTKLNWSQQHLLRF